MVVFNAFLKVLNKNKWIVLLYSVILIFFGFSNMQTKDTNTNFVSSKPDIFLINSDEEIGLTKNLIEYLDTNTNRKNSKEDTMDDALFYRDVNYIILIPENFREDFLNGKYPVIQVKSTGDYQASFAQLLLDKYIKIATIYQKMGFNEEEIIERLNKTLDKQVDIEITSTLDTYTLGNAVFYYNFLSYSMLAGCVYIVCLILASFKNENIRKRTNMSSMNERKYNFLLLLSNGLFACFLWFSYILLSFVLLRKMMFSSIGGILILNSFLFTLCALTIAFLIGTIVNNKNAINGIVNVVALGSSFLCGAFVPMEWLPDFVLKIAHLLPSYWYIKTNELLKTMETINLKSLKPLLGNMAVLLFFVLFFVVLTNWITHKKQRID